MKDSATVGTDMSSIAGVGGRELLEELFALPETFYR